ncbi:MAG: homocysteine S-methyltransferase family protein, partial [Candidatus Binatia bacterium]
MRAPTTQETLEKLLAERILILDGAMGTMIQRHRLSEDDFRGEILHDHPHELKGNLDVLSLTRPEIIEDIHRSFFDAGADVVETNTFSANAVSQADYRLEDRIRELNLASARIAVKVAREYTRRDPERPRFVAGSMGPMNKTLSMSRDVDRPHHRDVSFDQVKAAYAEQVRGLVDGGVDLL